MSFLRWFNRFYSSSSYSCVENNSSLRSSYIIFYVKIFIWHSVHEKQEIVIGDISGSLKFLDFSADTENEYVPIRGYFGLLQPFITID